MPVTLFKKAPTPNLASSLLSLPDSFPFGMRSFFLTLRRKTDIAAILSEENLVKLYAD